MRSFFRTPIVVKGVRVADPVLKPVAKIGVEQNIIREPSFDYERRLSPERVKVGFPTVSPNPIKNYQPRATMERDDLSRGVRSLSPVSSNLENHYYKFIGGFKNPSTTSEKIHGRVALHAIGFGYPQKPPVAVDRAPPGSIHPRQEEQWKETKDFNFLDRFFNLINSILRV